jgi:ATP-dependent DNA helicase RecG
MPKTKEALEKEFKRCERSFVKIDKKEMDFILNEGEGQFIEFKENLDSKNLAKEVVAFTNSSGGRIFLGISDDGKIKGIEITNKLKSEIQDLARNCDPPIKITINQFDKILIVEIEEGKNKPYSCSAGFYMRQGPNSQKMKRDEIIKLAINEGKIRFDEQICKNFEWKDFDNEKFEYYLKLARISDNLDRDSLLKNMKILTEEGMTNAGVLFFAKEPHKYIGNSRIRCVYFKDNERIDILDKKEIDKGIIGNIEFAISYLEERVPVEFKIRDGKREEFPEYLKDAYREAIVNAIVHRDYFIDAEVAVEKLKNKIFINNPGKSFVSKENLGKDSKLRNRLIADLLARTVYMEKVGTGINRIKSFCNKNDNKVEFDIGGNNFRISIFSNKDKLSENDTVKDTENDTVKDTEISLSKEEKIILKQFKNNPKSTSEDLAKLLDINLRNTKKWIFKLKKKGLVKRIGADKGGQWEILEKSSSKN